MLAEHHALAIAYFLVIAAYTQLQLSLAYVQVGEASAHRESEGSTSQICRAANCAYLNRRMCQDKSCPQLIL